MSDNSDIDESIFTIFPLDVYTNTILINVNTGTHFTGQKRFVISHKNSNFIWVNGTNDCLPYIIAPVKNVDFSEQYHYFKARVLNDILEYLSLLSVRYCHCVEVNSDTFKNYQGRMDSVLNFMDPWIRRQSSEILQIDNIPIYSIPLEDSESLMIALFRDGISSNNIFYSILSYFKIFEFYFPKHTDRNLWIDSNYEQAKKLSFTSNVIRGFGDWDKFISFVDIFGCSKGEYLYKECRLAIAHANKDPFTNPNIYSDYYEMYYAREVLKVLSWYLIIQKLDNELLA